MAINHLTAERLQALAELPGFFVPEVHGEEGELPAMAMCENQRLPAVFQVVKRRKARKSSSVVFARIFS